MATQTAAARIPRQFTGVPHAGMAAGQAHAPHIQTPRGGNPFRQAAGGGFDEEGHLLPPLGRPGTVSGIIGRMLDKADIEDFNAKQDVRNDAKRQSMQDASDSFWKEFDKDKNPDQALLRAVHPDQGGDKHFLSEDAMKAMTTSYAIAKQASGAQEPTDFSTKDVGNGYSVLTGPGMKPQVIKPQKSEGGHYFTDEQGRQFYTSKDNPTVAIPVMKQGAQGAAPEQMTGKQAVLKNLSLQEENHLAGQQQAALALAKMQETSSASSAVYGMINRGIALHTPLSVPEAEAYNQGYNELKIATASMMGGSRLKGALEASFKNLPAPGQANAFNIHQSIPALRTAVNMDMADTYTNLKGQHKPTDVAEEHMNMVGITPEYMNQVKIAQYKLQTAPNTLDDDDLNVLNKERQKQLTTGDQNMRIVRQLNQMGRISPEDFQKAAQVTPELLNTPPNEVRQNPRPWMPPQPAPMAGPSATAPIPPAPAPAVGPPLNSAQSQPSPGQAQGPSLVGPTGLPLSPPQGQTTGPQSSAPIPPPPAAAPVPPPQASMLNPIASAQAAEMPGAPPAAQDQTQPAETASATAPIPADPQANADIVSQHVDDVSQLLDSTRKILEATQPRPGVYSEQKDQLGAKSDKDE